MGPADIKLLLNLCGALVSGCPYGKLLKLDFAVYVKGDGAQLGKLHLCCSSIVEVAKAGFKPFVEDIFIGEWCW
ncbi:hypothetical protein IEO21_10252 [Rhodonia placenta]|uniref:Uncharacterized protein n=1 Tax=Rhodonia placenta TaxID=104341 RepID=A0A8H7TX48_9APHY|nr:hypothetical protein IEO21_10252 [Postia placenta]